MCLLVPGHAHDQVHLGEGLLCLLELAHVADTWLVFKDAEHTLPQGSGAEVTLGTGQGTYPRWNKSNTPSAYTLTGRPAGGGFVW
jgi:hypothetical protein